MNKARLYWIFQISGWSLYAFLSIVGSSFQSTHYTPIMAIPILMESGFMFFLTHYYRKFGKRRNWLNLSVAALIPKVSLAIFLMALPIYFIRVLVSSILGMYTPDLLSLANIAGNVIGNLIILFIWSSAYYAFHYFEKNNQSLKYEVAMNEMRLNQLKSQLNPHFVFNALNSIRALVDEDPGKSKRAINHLSNILRSSLVMDKKKLTSFKDELNTVQNYLALESIRFEERLHANYHIAKGSDQVLVPPMMIQTLVENGIKHGISKLKKGGQLDISTTISDDIFEIALRNTGHFKGIPVNGAGQGIRNTQQRLTLIYGEGATLEIKNENEHTVLTRIQIPLYTE